MTTLLARVAPRATHRIRALGPRLDVAFMAPRRRLLHHVGNGEPGHADAFPLI